MRIKTESTVIEKILGLLLVAGLVVLFFFIKDTYIPNHKEAEAMGTVTSSVLDDFQPATVIRVVDGDTLVCYIDGKDTKVRLIGVDTPESVHPDEEKNSKYGEWASNYLKELLPTYSQIYLEYDASLTDTYGRTLAYVYLSNGEMVQSKLLSEGYAKVMTVQPNVMHQDLFVSIQKDAQSKEKGFWKDYFNEK